MERLLGRGYQVVGVDAFTGNYSRRRKERNLWGAERWDGFRLLEGDLLTLDLDSVLAGVDMLAHLAGEPGVRRSWGNGFPRYLERNVLATQRLLDAAAKNGIKKFVYASSSSVYGPDSGDPVDERQRLAPASPYGVSKLAAEEMVALYARQRDIPATVLRYFTVYGPRQRSEMALARFIWAAMKGRPVEVFGDGEQVRDMTYVEDAVEATVAALEGEQTGTYNVGGGARASVNELLDAVRSVMDLEVEAIYGPSAAGDVSSTWADSRKAARDFGYRPRVALGKGIEAQAAWSFDESPRTSAL